MTESDLLRKILNSIIAFEKSSRCMPTLLSLVSAGLKVYESFPGAQFASLYLVDTQTFEIEHQETQPEREETNSLELYKILLDREAVGEVLSSGLIQRCIYDSEQQRLALVVPLITTAGVMGIVIVPILEDLEFYEGGIISTIEIFSSLFSNVISNRKLNIQLEKKLDQQVASRTIELVESKQDLAKRFESFRSSISLSLPHEVRTPLNHIIGLSDYLMNSTGPLESEENQELLGDISSAAERLNRLFENYILYNRLNLVASNMSELQKLRNDVTHLSVQTIENLVRSESKLKERIDDFQLDICDVSVAVSEEYFLKIFEEFVDNGIKYSKPGSPLIIAAKNDEDSVILSFEDHGIGMSKEQVKNLEAFTQFDRAKHEQQGAGLGMAIVARIMDIYKGKLTVDSKPGEYTKVTVELPIAESHFDD